MPQYVATLDCPHCKTTKSGMRSTSLIFNGIDYRVPLTCPHCDEIVIVGADADTKFERTAWTASTVFNLDDRNSVIQRQHLQYPKDMKREVPDDVPEKIGNTYEEALDNLHRGKYETSILLCGKAMDLATKGMDQTWKLEKRLKTLAADGKITAAMADWAQEIRIDRNAAIHEDDEFTQRDAEDIVAFTEAFLTYIYTLPALINSRRQPPADI
ncbi:DUF4145 domain-containing protein [Pseudomonas sp. NPDC088414]|uniref:DUF4145 domain-containing protein n=1 Tax=Pseudomonas sp. NPDC088414 TaxID=3364454 RepID=UPI0038266DCF